MIMSDVFDNNGKHTDVSAAYSASIESLELELEEAQNKIKELGGLLVGASATVQKLESDLEEMTEKRNSLMIELTSKMDRGEFYANFLESLMIDKLGVTLEDLELAKKEFDSLDPQLEKFKEPVEEIPQLKGTLDDLSLLDIKI